MRPVARHQSGGWCRPCRTAYENLLSFSSSMMLHHVSKQHTPVEIGWFIIANVVVDVVNPRCAMPSFVFRLMPMTSTRVGGIVIISTIGIVSRVCIIHLPFTNSSSSDCEGELRSFPFCQLMSGYAALKSFSALSILLPPEVAKNITVLPFRL